MKKFKVVLVGDNHAPELFNHITGISSNTSWGVHSYSLMTKISETEIMIQFYTAEQINFLKRYPFYEQTLAGNADLIILVNGEPLRHPSVQCKQYFIFVGSEIAALKESEDTILHKCDEVSDINPEALIKTLLTHLL